MGDFSIQDKAIVKLRQAEVIATLKAETIKDILNKYEVIASIESGDTSEDMLYNNSQIYSILFIPVVYRVIYNIVGSSEYNKFKGSIPKIDKILNEKSSRDNFFAKYGKKFIEKGFNINEYEELSENKIINILATLGAEETDDFDNIDILYDLEFDEELDIEDIINNNNNSYDRSKVEEDKSSDNEIDRLKSVWGDKVDIVIGGILNTYKRLYESGYGLTPPCGVLTNIGAVRSTTDGRIIQSGNKALDMELFKAITSVIRGQYDLYAENEKEPDIFEIERAGQPVIYVGMHLQFMFGHIRYCKGLQSYINKNNINNDSTTRMIKWGDMSGYIREKLEEYFYKAYIKYGISCDATDNDIQITNKINRELSKNLKNVIILAERQKGVNTRVRIASDSPIDIARVISELDNSLNVGTDSSIAVRQIGDYKDGVLDINVVYNERKFSQDTLFAYQVLDKLKEQGIRPRWDNVILGKKDNGTIMTYNFKDKRNAVYAIYASSGAGKGVMTLNLIASAVADLCKVLYIDGKPDMGEVLADIAWKHGIEAPVYNGVSGKGSEMLENRGTSIRQESQFMDAENIPDGIFITEQEKQKYMLITTYLRGIELICDTAANRSSQDLPSNDWITAFVDECEQAAVAELDVMDFLDRAESNRKNAKDDNGRKINPSTDEVLTFIRDYRAWQQSIKSKFKTCITSTFRYANMTVMFIWQSTKFPEQYKNKSIIAGVIDSSSGVITKIFGRGAAVNYGSKVFGTPTSLEKTRWFDERFTKRGGGYFAIGKDVNSDSMTVFRPFNIYSDANHKELIIENAKAVGISEEDLVGVSLDNRGNVIPEVGFEGYITKMLLEYGVTVEEQLGVSYEYFNTLVRQKGLHQNLNEYMFDCHNFNNNIKESDKGFASSIGIDSNDTAIVEDNVVEFGDDAFSDNIESMLKQDISDEYSDIYNSTHSNGYNKAVDDLNSRRINEYREGIKQAYNAKFNGNTSYEPEIEYSNSTIGVELHNGKINIRDTSGFGTIDVDASQYVEVDDRSKNAIDKFRSKLMEDRYGMNYNFKQRWQFLLNSISSAFPRDNMIVRVNILYDLILANNKIVNISSILDTEYGIMLEDIINFKSLFNRFQNIKELVLDSETIGWVAREFGQNCIIELFKNGSRLEKIVIDNGNGDVKVINRQKQAVESSSIYNEEELRRQIDQVSAGYSSRAVRRGQVYMDRISKGSMGFTKKSWSNVKNNFSGQGGKRHIIKGSLWIGAAAITATVGGLFWGGKNIIARFS